MWAHYLLLFDFTFGQNKLVKLVFFLYLSILGPRYCALCCVMLFSRHCPDSHIKTFNIVVELSTGALHRHTLCGRLVLIFLAYQKHARGYGEIYVCSIWRVVLNCRELGSRGCILYKTLGVDHVALNGYNTAPPALTYRMFQKMESLFAQTRGEYITQHSHVLLLRLMYPLFYLPIRLQQYDSLHIDICWKLLIIIKQKVNLPFCPVTSWSDGRKGKLYRSRPKHACQLERCLWPYFGTPQAFWW